MRRMRVRGYNRRAKRKAIYFQLIAALMALFALLVMRNAPPEISQLPSLHHSSLRSVSNHGHRPHFDSDASQWSAPVSHFLPFPPVAESAHLAFSSQEFSSFQAKGFHYNRPPPVS